MKNIDLSGDIASLPGSNRFIQAINNGLEDVKQGRVLTDEELDKALDDAPLD